MNDWWYLNSYFSQGCLNFSKGCGQAVSCNFIPLNAFIVSDKSGKTGGSWPRNLSDIPHFWTHHRSFTPNICSRVHLGESIPIEFLKITISERPFSFYIGKLKKSFQLYHPVEIESSKHILRKHTYFIFCKAEVRRWFYVSSSFLLHIKSLTSREKSMISYSFFSEWTGHRDLSCKDRLALTNLNNPRQTIDNTGNISSHCGGPGAPGPAAAGNGSSGGRSTRAFTPENSSKKCSRWQDDPSNGPVWGTLVLVKVDENDSVYISWSL